MPREISKTNRRLLVIVNYVSLISVAFLVHAGRMYDWDTRVRLAGILASCGVLLLTFTLVFWRTGLWQMAHASFEKLDERQVHVMYESLRHSYVIFTLLCVVLLYANAVAERGHIPILIAAGILYLAHTLPAAAAAWNEKEVLIDT